MHYTAVRGKEREICKSNPECMLSHHHAWRAKSERQSWSPPSSLPTHNLPSLSHPTPQLAASLPPPPQRHRAHAGGLTIFFMELLRFYALSGNSETAFTGFFQVVGAIVFTHLGVSILQQGSRTVSSGTYYQVCTTSTEKRGRTFLRADGFSVHVIHAHRRGGVLVLFWGGTG